MQDESAQPVQCASCGALLAADKAKCGNCGRPRVPKWPTKRAVGNAPDPVPPTADAHSQLISAHPIVPHAPVTSLATGQAAPSVAPPVHYSRLILVAEFLLGFIGVHGSTFFLLKKPGKAIGWLIFSAVWFAVRVGVTAITAGAGLVCVVPLGFLISVYVTFGVRGEMRHQEKVTPANGRRQG